MEELVKQCDERWENSQCTDHNCTNCPIKKAMDTLNKEKKC